MDSDVISTATLSENGVPRLVIPPEVRRLILGHSTGETVLHKAARLGYEVIHYLRSRFKIPKHLFIFVMGPHRF